VPATPAASGLSPDMVERFRRLDTEQVSDAMDELGLRRGGCPGIFPVNPSHKVVGPAYTLRFRSVAEVPEPLPEYLGMPAAGDVLVIANGGRLDCSVWGGQRTLAATGRGIAGSVLDGAYRDVRATFESPYPVFGRQGTMMRTKGVVSLAERQVPVLMSGVLVRPGDIVVGDWSGVMIVPAESAVAVLEATEALARIEAVQEEALRQGATWEEARANNPE
jgi:4-hydroxy-4-methyl-2-oxoglutarate aldolase